VLGLQGDRDPADEEGSMFGQATSGGSEDLQSGGWRDCGSGRGPGRGSSRREVAAAQLVGFGAEV
jgi:hypothetical protein